MVSPIHSSLSAINAFSKKMNVTANNVANGGTDNFKKSRVTFNEGKSGGVEAHISKVNTPGAPKQTIENDRFETKESSNVDLVEEMAESISSQHGHRANLKTIATQDEMTGSLLDIMG